MPQKSTTRYLGHDDTVKYRKRLIISACFFYACTPQKNEVHA